MNSATICRKSDVTIMKVWRRDTVCYLKMVINSRRVRFYSGDCIAEIVSARKKRGRYFCEKNSRSD